MDFDLIPWVILHVTRDRLGGQDRTATQRPMACPRAGTFLYGQWPRALLATPPGWSVRCACRNRRNSGVYIIGPMAMNSLPEGCCRRGLQGQQRRHCRICHAHPSLAESMKEAALAVSKRSSISNFPHAPPWPCCAAIADMTSVKQIYHRELATRGFQSDPAQMQAVAALEHCADEWAAYKRQRSARSRSSSTARTFHAAYTCTAAWVAAKVLMDCFYEAGTDPAQDTPALSRIHARSARELGKLQGTANPLQALGAKWPSRRCLLICFDEFHVADVTDDDPTGCCRSFDNGVGFVTTSNFKPDALYPNGLHRDGSCRPLNCSSSV